MSDSLRWDSLPFRDGDVVISAPSKSGLTWTQRLVALLVFGGPELPAPLSKVSPWLDQTLRPIEAVVADLEAQRHRRFIKTHTPLDGVPIDPRVTYICVGRDPRDAAVSMMFHKTNIDDSHMPPREHDMPSAPGFHDWMERPIVTPEGMESFAASLHHFGTFWQRRQLDNVALFHYSDLKADLTGEFLRLAAALRIPMDQERAAQLVGHASLDEMRSQAADFAPNSVDGLLLSNERFFRAGSVGGWRQHFTEQEKMRYLHRIHQLRPPPDMMAWGHDGRRGCDPDAAPASFVPQPPRM